MQLNHGVQVLQDDQETGAQVDPLQVHQGAGGKIEPDLPHLLGDEADLACSLGLSAQTIVALVALVDPECNHGQNAAMTVALAPLGKRTAISK